MSSQWGHGYNTGKSEGLLIGGIATGLVALVGLAAIVIANKKKKETSSDSEDAPPANGRPFSVYKHKRK